MFKNYVNSNIQVSRSYWVKLSANQRINDLDEIKMGDSKFIDIFINRALGDDHVFVTLSENDFLMKFNSEVI